MQARYPALVAASNEAWKTSAQVISLSSSSSSESESNDDGPSTSAKPTTTPAKAEANPNASPTTPTSPSTYYDARSRPMSMAVDDVNGDSDGKANKKQGKKRKGFIISTSKSASPTYPDPSGSSTSPGPTTDPKLSIKKMRAFLFTRTVPRPEVRGLFPSSLKMTMSRSKSSARSSEQEKGKGKEKYEESRDANGDGVAGDSSRQEKLNRIASLMNLRTTSATELRGTDVGVSVISEKAEMDNEKLQPIDSALLAPPLSRTRSHSPSRSPSPASVRSRHSRSLLNVETDKGGAVEGGATTTDATGEDSDAARDTAVSPGAGQLIDEQTATKSRSGFAILRMAETLVREGIRRICGPCFGYSD